VPTSAVVLTRDHEEAWIESNPDRLTRKTSMEAAAPVPFFSKPSQAIQQEKASPAVMRMAPAEASNSPRQRLASPSAVRRTSARVLGKDVEDCSIEVSAAVAPSERITASARPPVPVQRVQATATACTTSPRYDRPSSPFRWSAGSKAMPTATSTASVQPHEVSLLDDRARPVSGVIVKSADEIPAMTQGHLVSKAAAPQRNSRLARTTSPDLRARTLSPARPPPNMVTSSPHSMGGMVGKEKATSHSVTITPGAAKEYAEAQQRLPRPSRDSEAARRNASKDVPEVLEPPLQASPSYLDLKPWLEAAQQFQMNTDFSVDYSGKMDFVSLMAAMKKESSGKWTIQTMADKLLLNGLLENLGLPHMPMIFASRSVAKLRERLEVLVDKLIIATAKKQPYDIIVKPTHLSSAQGVMSFNKVHQAHREETICQLEKHMRKFIETSANKQESLALQSLKPGFIGQPKYKSIVGFRAPLELKVCALWGKARCGVWWWGTRMAGPAQIPHRNLWIVRDPVVPGELSENDGWEVLHNHPGGNAGWEQAVKLFKRHMPDMAALTETLAAALGTPFLRADFFVGSSKWGVRLNEVAYGCGLEYRNFLRENGGIKVIDDKPAMSEILRQGMALCHRRLPPHHFLYMLGVQGEAYENTAVMPLGSPLTTFAVNMNRPDPALQEFAIEEDLCKTVRDIPAHEGESSKDTNQNPQRSHEQVSPMVQRANWLKPHPGHIPTLVMPQMAKVISTHVSSNLNIPSTSVKGPMPKTASYLQHVPSAVAKSQSARPAVVLRAPMQ